MNLLKNLITTLTIIALVLIATPTPTAVAQETSNNKTQMEEVEEQINTLLKQLLSLLQESLVELTKDIPSLEPRDNNDDVDTEVSSPNRRPLTGTGTTYIDREAPEIANVATSSVSSSGITVTWSTNEPADSKVYYGETESYGSSTTSSTLTSSHSVGLSGLNSSTQYYFYVESSDKAGNTATSTAGTFTTNSDGGFGGQG